MDFKIKYLKYKAKYIHLNQKMNQSGGAVDRTSQSDSNDIYLKFINRVLAKNQKLSNVIARDVKYNGHLIVVDMQNDFVDRPYTDNNGDTIKRGHFGVSNGKECIDNVKELIENNNFKQVYFTRDYHPKEHCSFLPKGHYPPHCVQTTNGSLIVDELKDMAKNSIVMFKGFDKDYDSYGAAPYEDDEYGTTRQQLSGCKKNCITDTCSQNTGGFLLKGVDNPVDYLGPVDMNNSCQHQYENIKDGDNVFVVGLAGDYCVKDTAINIKRMKPRCKVYVINQCTRYALLPSSLIGPLDKHLTVEKGKPGNQYLITIENGEYRILTKDELLLLNEKEMNKNKYFSYLTDPEDLLNDYDYYNVKLII